MGNTYSASPDTSMLNRAGNYTTKFLREQWSGTEREGYRYSVSYAPTGRATCAHCKKRIAQGAVRIGRSVPSPFDAEWGATDYVKYFHASHAFDTMLKSRCASKVVLSPKTLVGIKSLSQKDKKRVEQAIATFAKRWHAKCL
jgi:hypothetical protein